MYKSANLIHSYTLECNYNKGVKKIILSTKDKNNNAVIGDSLIKDSHNNLIMSTKGFVGVIGADDLIIINTKDGLLVCKKDRSQEVKEIVDYLKRKGLSDYI